MLKELWQLWRINRTVNSYLYHKEQEQEWSLRYIADSDHTIKIRDKNIRKHQSGQVEALYKLHFKFGLPMKREIYLGDGRIIEFFIDEFDRQHDYLEVDYV